MAEESMSCKLRHTSYALQNHVDGLVPGLVLLGWVALRVYAAAMPGLRCLGCMAPDERPILTGCWLLFALFFQGLSSLAAFLLLWFAGFACECK
jgi:hypothetical protein